MPIEKDKNSESQLLLTDKSKENNVKGISNETNDAIETVKITVEKTIELSWINPLEQEFLDTMDAQIIWQENAKKVIARLVKNSVLWTKPRRGPLWVLFFSWPTWVWKTEIVKSLAETFFGDKWSFIKVNCENYQDNYSSANLFGAAKWLVWYHDSTPISPENVYRYYDASKKAWTLHNSLKQLDWFNIILFDEIEKAHPEVHQSLIWLMDEWRVEFSNWNLWNYKNSIIIFTSNIWQKNIENSKVKKTIWFAENKIDDVEEDKIVKEEIKKTFSPEFRWRIDKTINFDHLSKKEMHEILNLELLNLNKHFNVYYQTMSIKIDLWGELIQLIEDRWFSEESWARWLVRTFEKYVYNNLIDLFNSDEFKEYYNVRWTLWITLKLNDNNKVIFSIKWVDENIESDDENSSTLKLENNEKREKLNNLDELILLNKTVRDFVFFNSMHITGDIENYSKELLEIEKELIGLGLSKNDINKLRNTSFVDIVSEYTNCWLFEKLWDLDNKFYPLNNKVVSIFLEKKIVSYLKENSLEKLVANMYDIINQAWEYLIWNFLDSQNITKEQHNLLLLLAAKTLKEKYNIVFEF